MEFPAVRRTEPITIGQISSTTHVHAISDEHPVFPLLQWLHGKQQQQILQCYGFIRIVCGQGNGSAFSNWLDLEINAIL